MVSLSDFSFIRQRTKISPLDEFFSEGNVACFQGSKQVATDIDELLEDFNTAAVENIMCTEKGCSQCFPNNRAFDYHYTAFHRYRCKDCKANFPSDFLLELHIEENHDPLFESKVERGQSFYRCITDGCASLFMNRGQRNAHVIEAHKYPADFRFNKLKTTHGHKKKSQGDMDVDIPSPISTISAEELTSAKTGDNITIAPAEGMRSFSYKRAIPKSVCFGRGTERGFHRPRGTGTKKGGRGRSKGKNVEMDS